MDLELDISHLKLSYTFNIAFKCLQDVYGVSVICVSRQEALLNTKLSMCIFN